VRRNALGHGSGMAVTETGHAASLAIDDLYRRHGSEVYRYALAVLGNHADAEDITQTTFLNAYRSLEQGVRPRKPANWLLTIASNAIKQRFRHDSARPRQVVLDDRIADRGSEGTDGTGPTVGEILTALSHIPPQQRQAIVLREFEGRSYREIAEILGVTTSALETLLFRARRSLAEEIESQLSCTEAQLAISRAADERLGRKERRRLRIHVQECPDCARFARLQQRNRRAFRGLALVPVPVLDWPFRGLEAPAAAAVGVPAATAGVTTGVFGGGVAVKAAAVVTAASVAGGVGLVGGAEVERKKPPKAPARVEATDRPGKRVGQVAPRGVTVPGRGVAVGHTATASKPGKRNGVVRNRAGAGRPASGVAKQAERPAQVNAKGQVPPNGRSAEAKKKPRAKPEAAKAVGRSPAPKENVRGRGVAAPTYQTPVAPARGRGQADLRAQPRLTSAGAP
jgi:RNA polymerase sigma factor (sigma-70 family)